MKILAFDLQGAQRALLFGDERLENLRRLMDLGCFGDLAGNAREWNILARQAAHVLTLQEYLRQAGKELDQFNDFAALQIRLASAEWDACQLTVSFPTGSGSADLYPAFDLGLGEALQQLSDDTLILVIGDGCYVLVAATNPISGYQSGAALDVTPTVLELSGYPLPAGTEGTSWVAGMQLNTTAGLTDDEQALLRERLSGLGYI